MLRTISFADARVVRNSKVNSRLQLLSILACASISLIVTFTSYFYYTQPLTVDASFVYRGWPLSWMSESWALWNPPPYPYHVSFQPASFLIDLGFYAALLLIPTQLYLYSRKERTRLQTGALSKGDLVD